ncbi:hypothetical protein OCU04_002811 [Sclerotinia nivalis]|uniref:Uncharacterized protein n=1 Tax=Sclerotinia nivalis TaxID=352851 RepID=A0A9X0DPH4_9HELO|nr:hypothetical protein OCU04_002811 [Sclerotinia nivalis]
MSANSRRRILQPLDKAAARAQEEKLEDAWYPPPIVVPTAANYTRLERRWREFHTYIESDSDSCLQLNKIVLSKGRLKLFIEWLFNTSMSVLNESITTRSLKNSWASFRSIYQKKTSNKIPDQIAQEVLAVNYIVQLLIIMF